MSNKLPEKYIYKILKQVLLEKRSENILRTLEMYANAFDPEDNLIMMHFGNVNKLGINPKTPYHTPIGIYAYCLEPETFDDLKKIAETKHSGYIITFAENSKYIQIFKARANAKILNTETYTRQDLIDDVRKIREYIRKKTNEKYNQKLYEETIEYAESEAYKPSDPISVFWNITRWMSGYFNLNYGIGANEVGEEDINNSKWTFILNKVLGYDIVYDPGKGIIHINEPHQCLTFSTRSIQHLDTFENPIIIDEELNNQRLIKKAIILGRKIKKFLETSKNIKIDEIIDFYNQRQNIFNNYSGSPQKIISYFPMSFRYATLKEVFTEVLKNDINNYEYFFLWPSVYLSSGHAKDLVDDLGVALARLCFYKQSVFKNNQSQEDYEKIKEIYLFIINNYDKLTMFSLERKENFEYIYQHIQKQAKEFGLRP